MLEVFGFTRLDIRRSFWNCFAQEKRADTKKPCISIDFNLPNVPQRFLGILNLIELGIFHLTLPKCLEYFEIIWTRIPPKKYWSKDQRMVTTSFPAMSHIMPPYQRYCCLNHQTPSQVPVARNSASSTSRSSSPWVKLLTSRCALVLVEREQQVNIGDFSASNMGIQPSKMMISPSKLGI